MSYCLVLLSFRPFSFFLLKQNIFAAWPILNATRLTCSVQVCSPNWVWISEEATWRWSVLWPRSSSATGSQIGVASPACSPSVPWCVGTKVRTGAGTAPTWWPKRSRPTCFQIRGNGWWKIKHGWVPSKCQTSENQTWWSVMKPTSWKFWPCEVIFLIWNLLFPYLGRFRGVFSRSRPRIDRQDSINGLRYYGRYWGFDCIFVKIILFGPSRGLGLFKVPGISSLVSETSVNRKMATLFFDSFFCLCKGLFFMRRYNTMRCRHNLVQTWICCFASYWRRL